MVTSKTGQSGFIQISYVKPKDGSSAHVSQIEFVRISQKMQKLATYVGR